MYIRIHVTPPSRIEYHIICLAALSTPPSPPPLPRCRHGANELCLRGGVGATADSLLLVVCTNESEICSPCLKNYETSFCVVGYHNRDSHFRQNAVSGHPIVCKYSHQQGLPFLAKFRVPCRSSVFYQSIYYDTVSKSIDFFPFPKNPGGNLPPKVGDLPLVFFVLEAT